MTLEQKKFDCEVNVIVSTHVAVGDYEEEDEEVKSLSPKNNG